MTDLLHFPFEPGMSDNIDPAIGESALRVAENVRWYKKGRTEKRYGTQTMTARGNGIPVMMTDFNGHNVYAAGTQFWKSQGMSGTNSHVASTFRVNGLLPVSSEVIARSDRGTSINNQDCATSAGIMLFCWDDGTYVYYALQTSTNSVTRTVRIGTGTKPRAVAVGTKIWITYASDATNLAHYSVDVTTLATSGPTTLAVRSSVAFDVSTYSSTQWMLAYLSALKTVTIAVMTDASASDSTTATLPVSDPYAVAIAGSGAQGWALAAFNDGTAVYMAGLSTPPLALISSVVDVTGGVNQHSAGQPAVGRDLSGNYWVIWTGVEPTRYFSIRRRVVTLLGGLSTPVLDTYHFRLASKPFSANNTAWFVWGCSDNQQPGSSGSYITGWDLQRSFQALDLQSTTVAECSPHLHDGPAIGTISQADGSHIPSVAQRSDGQWCFPALHVLRNRTALSAGDSTGLDALYYKDSSSIDGARRDIRQAQQALHMAGGVLCEYTSTLHEANFFRYPVIVDATSKGNTGAGVLMSAGTYQYTVQYDWPDGQGRRQRSAPSEPATVVHAAGTANAAELVFTTYGIGKGVLGALTSGDQTAPVVAHIYRTTANGTTFYRLTPNSLVVGATGPQLAWGGFSGPTITFLDKTPDTNLGSQEILDVEGGVLANVLPPACQFTAAGGNRLWLGGLFNRTEVVCSKLLVPGEPAQFTGDAAFSVFFPDTVTALIWADGALVGFTADGIYIVNGEGPNDQGAGSFSTPQRLPSEVGCTNWRSVVETAQGWLFQSKRGIYLLPRGFGPPVFIGAAVQDTLKTYPYIRSATHVPNMGSGVLGSSTVRFVVAAGTGTSDECRVLVLDTVSLTWQSLDNYGEAIALGGVMSDVFTYGTTSLLNNVGLRQETYSSFGDRGANVSMKLRTGQYRPFGLLGSGKIYKLGILGEIRTPASLYTTVSFDGASGVALTTVTKTGYPGERFYQQHNLPAHHCNSIDVEVWDGATGSNQGLVLHGVTFEVDPSDGLIRLPAADTA